MKRRMAFLLALMLCLCASFAISEEAPEGGLRLRLTAGDAVLYATLEDNSASRSLLGQLPLTLTFSDYNGTEKIAYPPEELDASDAPDSCDPDVGTLACYAPWGNLCIFYRDFRFSEGLIPLGRIDEGVDALVGMTGDFTVLLEDANAPEASASPLPLR